MSTDIEDIEIKTIDQEKIDLIAELLQVREKLAELGISGNRGYYMRGTIDKDIWATRTVWAKRVLQIEKRIQEINASIRSKNIKHYDRENRIREVLKETFGRDISMQIIKEAESRNNGGHPMKISLPAPKSIESKTYKKELNDAVGLLIKARNAITRYVISNEPEINKANYLIQVHGLNTCLPSLSELDKLKP